MDTSLIFFLGLVIGFVGVIPPGLLNMSAAKISLTEGYNRGIMFSIGACIIVGVQTTLAAVFARYLNNHPDVVSILKQVALIIFLLIAIYFFFFANKKQKPKAEIKIQSRKSRFFQGMLMSALNVFPIPFQAYITLTLASIGWMYFDNYSITSYVAGATMGSFVMLYVYIFFFDKIKSKTLTSQKNMNYLIGSITGIVAIVTLIGVLKEL